MIGQVFGRLTVLEEITGNVNGRKRYLCRCECVCGKSKIIRTDAIKSGVTTSCGCFQSERASQANRRNFSDRAFNSIESSYIGGANQKNLEYKLTKLQFKEIVSQNCHYCGCKPRKVNWKRFFGKYVRLDSEDVYANGIDRVDNSKGYVLENCVPCCEDCNYSKRGKSYIEFIAYLKRISDFILSKN